VQKRVEFISLCALSLTELVHFFCCSSVNSDLSAWNVSQVESFYGTFLGATSFNSDLSAWTPSSAKDCWYMFGGASNFNSNLCSWGERIPSGQLIDVTDMFLGSGCPVQDSPNLADLPAGPWCFDCSQVISPPFPLPFNFSIRVP
jgi:surface protein